MSDQVAVVTGSAGFIGTHVAQIFASQGWRIVGMGHGTPSAALLDQMASWRNCDVTRHALVDLNEHVAVIVHCAGGASVGASIDNPGLDFERTVKTTSEVLEYIRLDSPKTRLVYLSSAAVYGEVASIPIRENVDLKPVSPYGYHKAMCEALCRMYGQQYGVATAIVRPFSIFGAGLRKQLLWDACRKYSEGDDEFFGTGMEVRDWLYVGDLASLLLLAAEHASIECPVVNAGSGQGVANRTLLARLGNRLGASAPPRFSSSPKTGDPAAYVAAISEARQWGWNPTVSWQDGVDAYVDWYKQCN